jgi:hypothetical protein
MFSNEKLREPRLRLLACKRPERLWHINCSALIAVQKVNGEKKKHEKD